MVITLYETCLFVDTRRNCTLDAACCTRSTIEGRLALSCTGVCMEAASAAVLRVKEMAIGAALGTALRTALGTVAATAAAAVAVAATADASRGGSISSACACAIAVLSSSSSRSRNCSFVMVVTPSVTSPAAASPVVVDVPAPCCVSRMLARDPTAPVPAPG